MPITNLLLKLFFRYVYVLTETQTNRNINPLFLHTRLTYENITLTTLTPIWFKMNNLLINHKLTEHTKKPSFLGQMEKSVEPFMPLLELLRELNSDSWFNSFHDCDAILLLIRPREAKADRRLSFGVCKC